MNREQILICGRVGAYPELSLTKNNEVILKFSIAEKVENSEKPIWHKVVVWGDHARRCKEQITKGSLLFIRGINQHREFTTKDGIKRNYTEVKATLVGITIS